MDRYQKKNKTTYRLCNFEMFSMLSECRSTQNKWLPLERKYQESKHFNDRPVTQTAMFHNFCGQEIVFTKISAV